MEICTDKPCVKNNEQFIKTFTETYTSYAAPGIWKNSWQPIKFVELTKMMYNNKSEVETEVKNCIKKAAKGGGYILLVCHSHPYVDPERLQWMVDAARRYGKCPISV